METFGPWCFGDTGRGERRSATATQTKGLLGLGPGMTQHSSPDAPNSTERQLTSDSPQAAGLGMETDAVAGTPEESANMERDAGANDGAARTRPGTLSRPQMVDTPSPNYNRSSPATRPEDRGHPAYRAGGKERRH
ncbi:UNVERIFIED_CONTAM: hypothetical protein K2H54_052706 [Gekko kuhli]